MLRPVTTEDVATVLLRTAEGVLGSLTVSQVSAGRKNRLWFELDGAAGSAVFDQENPESVWLGDAEGARIVVRDPGQGSAEQRRLATLPAGHAQGYGDCFRAFVDDPTRPWPACRSWGCPTAADGVRSARLVDAVLRADDSLTLDRGRVITTPGSISGRKENVATQPQHHRIGILGSGNIFGRYVTGLARYPELEIVRVGDIDVGPGQAGRR